MTYNKHNYIKFLLTLQHMADYGMVHSFVQWMSEITGQEISRQQGWEYLKQMEYSLKVPRPQHREISLDEQIE